MNTNYASHNLYSVRADNPPAVRDRFREVLSRFGSGVVVITSTDQTGSPVGVTMGSFTSISMEPPLVGFFAGHTSSTLPHVLEAGSFCVNVLSEDQHLLARSFARSGSDKFSDVAWTIGQGGAPLLAGAHAWIECTVSAHRPIGDHELVVGHVGALLVPFDTAPLLFHGSEFHGLRAHR